MGLVAVLALVVGARLNDAGRSPWIVIGATILLVLAVPVVFTIAGLVLFAVADGSPDDFLGVFAVTGLVPLALLIAPLIRAGTRPRAPLPVPSGGPQA